ncbi:MAG: GDP-mannose 4,6-dehydratase, partial [Candidatus Marinimicrobia bacterium]|nr:GDP-mannose 4,6-dehydratase [Candidatus Neomarinimicrobiota bacterium]
MSKRILITGGAGFIAHHVIDKILSTTDWEIITLDRLDFSGNLNRLKEVVDNYPKSEQKRVKVVHHDLKAQLNPEICATIGRIDYISHLAAGSHVDRS